MCLLGLLLFVMADYRHNYFGIAVVKGGCLILGRYIAANYVRIEKQLCYTTNYL
jgi:hypothetical protein